MLESEREGGREREGFEAQQLGKAHAVSVFFLTKATSQAPDKIQRLVRFAE